MAVIGKFAPTKDGGWEGTIRTLTINAKIRFVPNDNRGDENAPAFRLFTGSFEIGAGWSQRANGDNPREYLSIKLDDPSFSECVSAALFESADGQGAHVVWTRRSRL